MFHKKNLGGGPGTHDEIVHHADVHPAEESYEALSSEQLSCWSALLDEKLELRFSHPISQAWNDDIRPYPKWRERYGCAKMTLASTEGVLYKPKLTQVQTLSSSLRGRRRSGLESLRNDRAMQQRSRI